MKKKLLILALFLVSIFTISAQDFLVINGQVTDEETGLGIPNHIVFASTSDSLLYLTFITDEAGFYGDSIILNQQVNSVHIYTFDCNNMMHDTIVTDLTATIIANFEICSFPPPPDCQAMFFYYPMDSLNTDLTYQFIDMSLGAVSSWLWDFGDGTTSTEQNPVHTFSEEGLYTVCLTISDEIGSCTDTFCEDVYVEIYPPFDCYNFFDYVVDDNYNVTFTGEAFWGGMIVTADSYLWDFGDGTTGEGQTVTHQYDPSAGDVFEVCLTTVSVDPATGDTCEAVSCIEVWLINFPNCEAMYIYYPYDSIPTDLTYQFLDVSFGNINYWFWDFGDGNTSYEQNPVHTFGEEGIYTVCLTIEDADSTCFDTFCMDVIIGEIPPGGCDNFFFFMPVDSLTYSFIGEAHFGGAIVEAESYLWDFGDGTTGEGQNITHTFESNNSGMYVVCLTTTYIDEAGDTCVAISCQDVIVNIPDTYTLWGQVFMGNDFADFGQVMLMTMDPATGIMYITDIQLIDSSGTYIFNEVFPGDYNIFAELLPGSSGYNEYLPTYYGDVLFWEDATLISIGDPQNPYDINLIQATSGNIGPGLIEGVISEELQLFKNGRSGAEDVEILLLNHNYNPLDYRYSDVQGAFDFGDLSYGLYTVYAEVPGKTTIPATVEISEEVPHVIIDFVITGDEVTIVSTGNEILAVEMEIFPNPANEKVTVSLFSNKEASIVLEIMNLMGQTIKNNRQQVMAGVSKIELKTGEIPEGIYMIKITSEEGQTTVKKLLIAR